MSRVYRLNNSKLSCDRSIIYGNNNHITGSDNMIIGSNNYMNGFHGYVKGNNNIICVSKCCVKGDHNRIYGSNCDVRGNYNTSYGSHNKLIGNDNIRSNLSFHPFNTNENNRYRNSFFNTIGISAIDTIINSTRNNVMSNQIHNINHNINHRVINEFNNVFSPGGRIRINNREPPRRLPVRNVLVTDDGLRISHGENEEFLPFLRSEVMNGLDINDDLSLDSIGSVQIVLEVKEDVKAKEDDKELMCVICTENKKCVLYTPCNHVSSCNTCAQQILKTKPECPLCREPIVKLTHIFL